MRILSGMVVAAVALLTGAVGVCAQTKENEWIAKQVESGGFGKYLLATLVVVLAAILMAVTMLRRSKR